MGVWVWMCGRVCVQVCGHEVGACVGLRGREHGGLKAAWGRVRVWVFGYVGVWACVCVWVVWV